MIQTDSIINYLWHVGIPMVSQEAGDGDDVQHDAFNENISEDLTDIDSDLEVIEDEFPPEIFCVADNVDQKVCRLFCLLSNEYH